MKKRGRPRNRDNPEIAQDDEIIARSVHRLIRWGFPQRRSALSPQGVFDVVAAVACTVLKRCDSNGLALSGEQIRKIYDQWIDSDPLVNRRRHFYKKESIISEFNLSKHTPLGEVALILIRNKGSWPDADALYHQTPPGDVEMTPKGWTDWQARKKKMPRLVFKRKQGN